MYESLSARETEEESTTDESKVWIFFGICAALCFSITNVLLGSVASGGIKLRVLCGYGAFIYSFTYWAIMFIRNYQSTKKIWVYKDSNFYDVDTTKFNWKNGLGVLAYSTMDFVTLTIVIYVFYYALLSGMNIGVVTAIFSSASIFQALAAYIMFKDAPNKYHLIGMGLLVACVLFISLASYGDK